MKSVVITGSSRGIGLAMATEFLQAGCNVTLSGKNPAHLEKAVRSLAAYEKRILACLCDVTVPADVQGLWDESARRWGTVDIWINNAGIAQDQQPVWEIDPDQARAIVETNISGLIHGSRVAFLGMRAQGHGQIFNMEGWGSDGSHMNGLNLYGMTKRAVRYVSHGLRDEAKGSGVLVGTLSPGMMATDFILEPMRRNPEAARSRLRIINIIADKPETVARFLVPRMLANKKQGAHIQWLTKAKAMWRFMTAGIVKREIVKL